MKVLLFIFAVFVSAFAGAQAIVMFAIEGISYKKAYLFLYNAMITNPYMSPAWLRVKENPFSYHHWKNVVPSWMEISQEGPSKFMSLGIVFWFFVAIIGWIL